MQIDNSLEDFTTIDQKWKGILVGNGASMAIAATFGYASLYDTSCSNQIDNPLTDTAKSIFSEFNTTNFEYVLSKLSVADKVNSALGTTTTEIKALYKGIQRSLIDAVHAVHTPYSQLAEDTLAKIRSTLRKYHFVFSTNYDLFIYWALMSDHTGFSDFFFKENTFEITNTEIWYPTTTRVLYLHGGLHLYRTVAGTTIKRTAGSSGSILDSFATPISGHDQVVPLFVSEGTYQDKLHSIFNSDYLSFGYSQLSSHEGPLVIFGHALHNEFDWHLTTAIRNGPCKVIGVGIHISDKDNDVAQMKLEWHTKFPKKELHFFRSSTHPLGDAALGIEEVATE